MKVKCDGCNGNEVKLQKVTVIWNNSPFNFTYCEKCIKEDIRKGFSIFNEEGKKFIHIPEKFYLEDAETN